MKDLEHGIIRFQQEDFKKHESIFKKLSSGQSPHSLFIGCADSRVVPSLITKTNPGELFIVRNIGNIVPPYEVATKYNSTTSAIEYAVLHLEVDTIVVCGHSNCGGCAALYSSEDELKNMPHIKRWLEISKDVVPIVEELMTEGNNEEREWITEQVNVFIQLEHLMTYPYIKERVKSGKLKILGWHYIIETGEVYFFNETSGFFELISV